ncbi:MAG: DUF4097 domain-containing protein [Defluviitaleaceae bacterium]|nr:DUF4097 domain-containing protein [Defluviitaleaceae bacterium]
MNEGKVKILEMLAEGKITVEQSLELMAQFEKDQKASSRGKYTDPRQINPNKHSEDDDDIHVHVDFDSDFASSMSSLGDRIKESVGNFVEGLDDVDIHINLNNVFGFGSSKNKSIFTYTSDPIAQSISQLKLLGKNSKVEIKPYDGDRIRITCKYNPKRPDAQIVVNEAGGGFEVLYDYNAMRSLAIQAEVPRGIFVESIHGESKNSSVELEGVKCRNAHLITKNSSIRVENVECDEIVARTRNSSIKAEKVTANHIDFETSNSKIDLEDSTAQIARLTTSNSKVITEYCDIEQLYIKTSNAGIKMENIFAKGRGATGQDWEGERVIEAHTSNGGVTIYVPHDVSTMLQASTSNGRVDSELPNMIVNEMSKNYFSGKNASYDTAAKRAKVKIGTSNSVVKLRNV